MKFVSGHLERLRSKFDLRFFRARPSAVSVPGGPGNLFRVGGPAPWPLPVPCRIFVRLFSFPAIVVPWQHGPGPGHAGAVRSEYGNPKVAPAGQPPNNSHGWVGQVCWMNFQKSFRQICSSEFVGRIAKSSFGKLVGSPGVVGGGSLGSIGKGPMDRRPPALYKVGG